MSRLRPLAALAVAGAALAACASREETLRNRLALPAAGGSLIEWQDVRSIHLERARNVTIWLPPGYGDDSSLRYPVIYAHDGQNLFVPERSFTKVDWGIDEAIVRGMSEGSIEPAIVIGVWNTADRRREYSPWDLGPRYAQFLCDELMPQVNRAFRTRVGPASTATVGASMGGVISFWLCWKHPERFGLGGCLSTHFPYSAADSARARGDADAVAAATSTPLIDAEIAAGATFNPVPRPRIWMDHGTLNLDSGYGPVQERVDEWLERSGMRRGTDFESRVYDGADHNEAAWRARVGDALRFLLPDRDGPTRPRRAPSRDGAGSLRSTQPWKPSSTS